MNHKLLQAHVSALRAVITRLDGATHSVLDAYRFSEAESPETVFFEALGEIRKAQVSIESTCEDIESAIGSAS